MARLQERLNAETVENYGVTTGDLDKVRTIAPSHVAIVREYLVDLLTPEEFATIGKAFERVLMSLNPSDTARLPDA